MVYLGKVKNGAIVLDPEVRLPDGADVRIELTLVKDTRDRDPLFQMSELAVETGIPDLATNADHYL